MAKQSKTLPSGTHVPKNINLNGIQPGRFTERKKKSRTEEFEEPSEEQNEESKDENQRIQDGFKFLDEESD